MSSYRRFISYMHQYSKGKKGLNCGFVKIEIKQGVCTLSFHLKKVPSAEPFSLSFFIHENTTFSFIPIWSCSCPTGIFQQQFATDSLHLFQSNYSFEQCSGIVLHLDNHILSGCSWDKTGSIPISLSNIIPEGEKEQKNGKKFIPDIKPEIDKTDVSSPSENKDFLKQADDPADNSSESQNDPRKTSSVFNEPLGQSSKSTPSSNELQEEPKEASPSSNEPQKEPEKSTPTFEELWASMQKKYPPLDPFEEGGIVEGIKISPSDLPYLQFLKFDLGANRFLLHGYKNYKHLLLGRMEGQNRYILGVPGIYDSQEQFMAKMFGFPCFKPIRSCMKPVGQFGYWFRCIHS